MGFKLSVCGGLEGGLGEGTDFSMCLTVAH